MMTIRNLSTLLVLVSGLFASCVTTGDYAALEQRFATYKTKADERDREAEQALVELGVRAQTSRQAIAALEAKAPLTTTVLSDLEQQLAARSACAGTLPTSSLVRAAPPALTTSAANATVEIIVVGDIARARDVEAELRQLRRVYGEQLQWTFIHAPISDMEPLLLAARAVVAAGMQGHAWDMYDKVYARGRARLPSRQELRVFAMALGLDLAAFQEDLDSARVASFVARNQALAKAVGVSDSPSVFVNGKAVLSTGLHADFEAAIETELAAARRAGRSGPTWVTERTKAQGPELHRYVYGGVEPTATDRRSRRSGPVATVNGVAITAEAFYAELAALSASAKSSNHSISSAEAEWQALGKVIDHALIAQVIEEAGIIVQQADIDTKMIEQLGIAFNEPVEVALTAIARHHREVAGLVRLLDSQRRIEVTEADVKSAYDRNKRSWSVVPAGMRLSDIFVALAHDASPDEERRALTKVKEARDRVEKGADFAVVAKQMSEGTLAYLGGNLGFLPQLHVGAVLGDGVAKLTVGEVSEPIRTRAGYHLVKVTDRRDEQKPSFEEVKPRIIARLKAEKVFSVGLLAFQREKATIEVLWPELARMSAAKAAAVRREDPAGWDPVMSDEIVFRVTVDPEIDPIMGARDAQVTLVVFSDFQFAANGKLKKTLDQVMAAYDGKVRLVYKAYPAPSQYGYTRGQAVAEAALCGQVQGKFWPLYAKLFDNQQVLEDIDLIRYVTAVGLDLPRWQACVDTHATKALVDAHVALGKQVANGWATFVNGRRVGRTASFEAFKTIIDEELAKTRVLSDRTGLEGQALYQHIIRDGVLPFELGRTVHRFVVDANTPVSGAVDARIQVVVFGDFVNAHSARVAPILAEVQRHYGGDLAIVYKYFPRTSSPHASEAALAATCAQEQGKFWPNHDRFYADRWALENKPGSVRRNVSGVDEARFDACVASFRYQAVLDMNRAEAKAAGVDSTPTLFINGQRFSWPTWPDKEDFISVIDTYVLPLLPAR